MSDIHRDTDGRDIGRRLVELITEAGWRAEDVNVTQWRISLVALPPLARSDPRRNRWPNEPEEGFEPGARDERGGFFAEKGLTGDRPEG